MRGQAKYWGKSTTCTIVFRNGKWYASITVDVLDQVLKPEILPIGAIGIDLGCNSALSITDGENHQQIDAPKFLQNAEHLIKKASKDKRRKRFPNRKKKILASRRFKKAQLNSSTSSTSKQKQAGSMKHLGAKKRQKSIEDFAKNKLGDVETHSSGEANCG